MNILMIHPHDLYSPLEPWTIRIKNIAREFIRKGHQVKLVYFPLDKRGAYKKFFDNNIEIISLDRRVGLLLFLRNIIRVVRLAKWCNIIHFQKCHYYAALPALIAAWIRNRPIHYDWDDWETEIFYYSNPKQIVVGEFINIFENLIPKVVNTISVSSNHLRKLCLKRGVSSENIFSAPVGADLELFRPKLSSRGGIKRKYNIYNHLVLYVGQLHGGQYAELFIKAANAILKNRKDITFMVVGDGYRLRELRELKGQLNLDSRCIFTGSVAHNRIPYYLADADVCVACFEDDDIARCKSPLKIVEYLACAKAIVASNVGEVRNMVGGVGILTEPGDVNSLVNGILTLLGNENLRKEMEKRARERVEKKYNWAQTAENLLRAYERALNSKSNRLGNTGWKMFKNKDLKILTAKVVSVSEHVDAPYTIEIKTKGSWGEKDDALTIDPRCTFYKDNKRPKTVDIVKLGDTIEATYIVHEDIKVALNIIVKSR